MEDARTAELQARSSTTCAACKIRRRKCGNRCALAPYFPPDNPQRFLTTIKVFRASKIAKIIKDIPPEKRSDAVNSMVYEASVRRRDLVNGCAGVISELQKHVLKLQSQLTAANEELTLLQKLAHASSFPKEEAKICKSDMTLSTPQELDVQMDNLLGEDVLGFLERIIAV